MVVDADVVVDVVKLLDVLLVATGCYWLLLVAVVAVCSWIRGVLHVFVTCSAPFWWAMV